MSDDEGVLPSPSDEHLFTRFAARHPLLNDYGCHMFVGRGVPEHGPERYVILESARIRVPATIEALLDPLCEAVRQGRSVLLAQSPGRVEETYIFLPGPFVYKPLEPRDYVRLRELYRSRVEMESYPDPFENQPEGVFADFDMPTLRKQ